MRPRLSLEGVVIVLAFALAALFSGCASTDRFNRLAADLTHQAIVASEQHRCVEHAAPCLTDAQFKAVNVELHKVSVAGAEFTRLRIAGTASVKDAQTFLATVAEEVAKLSRAYPDGAVGKVLAILGELQAKAAKLIGGQS